VWCSIVFVQGAFCACASVGFDNNKHNREHDGNDSNDGVDEVILMEFTRLLF